MADRDTDSHKHGVTSVFAAFLAPVRQLRFPPEFRIPPAESSRTMLEEAAGLISDLLRQPNSSALGSKPHEGQGLQDGLLVRVATGIWRVRQRMLDPATGQPKEEMRRTYRHVESVWDALNDFGVEIRDHTGEPFSAGMALSVLSYERDPILAREVVKETIKPTVFLRDRCIQRGEVIVGGPEA